MKQEGDSPAISVFKFIIFRPMFTEAAEIAVKYVAETYVEDVVVDEVFLHGAFLAYKIDGHFHDSSRMALQLLVRQQPECEQTGEH